MFRSYPLVPNLCWLDEHLTPLDDDELGAIGIEHLARVRGRFALAHRDGDRVLLARDKLGLNKLYYAHHPGQGLIAGSFLADLLDTGVVLDEIYAVPAGGAVEVDLARHELRAHSYHRLPRQAGGSTDLAATLTRVHDRLTTHFAQLAASAGDAKVMVCLSGGLDSSLAAALARKHFTDVTAYTYTFLGPGGQYSADAVAAGRLAASLGFDHRLVVADAGQVLDLLPRALVNGQDWRDFNVHCAIVNELLAEAIAADHPGRRVLVLSGDLMNELLGDYTPVHYRGTEYYPLPALPPGLLRISLTRGMQTGDREVGVFAARGLEIVQPYAAAFEELLGVPSALAKGEMMRRLAGDLLPDHLYGQPKTRAQIGDPTVRDGILPLFADAGHDGQWLEKRFCQTLRIDEPGALQRCVRGGVFRATHRYPGSTR